MHYTNPFPVNWKAQLSDSDDKLREANAQLEVERAVAFEAQSAKEEAYEELEETVQVRVYIYACTYIYIYIYIHTYI